MKRFKLLVDHIEKLNSNQTDIVFWNCQLAKGMAAAMFILTSPVEDTSMCYRHFFMEEVHPLQNWDYFGICNILIIALEQLD